MKEATKSYSFLPSDKEGMYLNSRFSLPAGKENVYKFAQSIFDELPEAEFIEVMECINLPGVDSARVEFKEFLLRSEFKELEVVVITTNDGVQELRGINTKETNIDESVKKRAEFEARMKKLNEYKNRKSLEPVDPDNPGAYEYYQGLKKAIAILNGEDEREDDNE